MLRADYSRMHGLAAGLRKAAQDASAMAGEVYLTATESRSAQENFVVAEKNAAIGRNPFTLDNASAVHRSINSALESLRPSVVTRALLDGARVAAGIMRNQARSMFQHGSGQLAKSISARVSK